MLRIIVLSACLSALTATSALPQEDEKSMDCNAITMSVSRLSEVEDAANKILGQHEDAVRQNFSGANELKFAFLERLSGRSGKRYDLYSASEGAAQIFVAFELEDGTISQFHVRSYASSYSNVEGNPVMPAQCFIELEKYFEFIEKKFPAGVTAIDDVLLYGNASDLFLNYKSSDDKLGTAIFLQQPFPLGFFEEDIGGNMSPNMPNGFCVTFDISTRIIIDYKVPYQCNVDMALLASQIEDQLGKGD